MKSLLILMIWTITVTVSIGQNSLSEAYLLAIKNQTVAPVRPYFLSSQQKAEILSWPRDAKAYQKLDSLQIEYEQKLLKRFLNIKKQWKEEQFIVKQATLIKAERTPGVFAVQSLCLSGNGMEKQLFVHVYDFGGKDYIVDILPVTTRTSLHSIGQGFTQMINNQLYTIWRLTRVEREKAMELVENAFPITVANKTYQKKDMSTIPLVFWMSSTWDISKNGNYKLACIPVFKEGKQPIVLFVDLEDNKVTAVEHNLDFPRNTVVAQPRTTAEVQALLQGKYTEDKVLQFIEFEKTYDSYIQFIDELRERLVQETGGYEEIDGRKRIVGKRNKEIPTKILVTEGEGAILAKKIENLRFSLLNLVDDETDKERLERELLLVNTENSRAKELGKTWAAYHFEYMPLAAVLPMLRKWQNDAKSSREQVLNYLLDKK